MTDPTDPLRNPRDPLLGTASDNALELFRAFGKLAANRPNEDVVNAAAAVLINAIRQACPDWTRAELAFDEIFGRSKQNLKDHYDGTSGRKKGVFPYDQVIGVPLLVDKDLKPH